MIQVYPAASRYSADHGWLKSNFSFSFADYYDPNNTQFGPLRVFNDDFVQPGRGFGAHPHREMEIVSVVLKGYLKHEDSAGNSATTTFGEIQRMSAGTGIIHSEVNPSDSEEVNFLQLWFLPNQQGLEPSYEKTTYDLEKLKNQLLPVVSHQSSPQVAHIHQDLTMYLSQLDRDKSIHFSQEEGRKVYIFTIEGELIVNGQKLEKRDSARITDTPKLNIEAKGDSLFMLIDLP